MSEKLKWSEAVSEASKQYWIAMWGKFTFHVKSEKRSKSLGCGRFTDRILTSLEVVRDDMASIEFPETNADIAMVHAAELVEFFEVQP